MVQSCFIKGCKNRFSKEKKLSFFLFPSDGNERKRWQETILRSNTQYCGEVSKYSKVCEAHFTECQIMRKGSRCALKKGAVPTVFPNSESRHFTNASSNEFVDMECLHTEEEELFVGGLSNTECLELSPSGCCTNATSNEFMDMGCLHTEEELFVKELSDIECLELSPLYETSVDLKKFIIDQEMPSEPSPVTKSIEELSTVFICRNCGSCELTTTTTGTHEACSVTSCCMTKSAEIPKTPSVVQKNSCVADNLVSIDDKNESVDIPKRGTKRRLHYPGDVKDNELLTPRSSKKFINNLKGTVTKQRLKIQNLNKRKRRAVKRISSLKNLVSDLKKKNLVSENALESLKLHDESLMQKIKVGKVNNKFPADVRSFALTLNFYSPRAYRYVRKSFAKNLPAPRTIRKWYESVDADPGITVEALKALNIKIEESRDKGIDLRFCMSIDEMSIRKQIEYSNSKKKYYGYVDFGGENIDRENTAVATKALVVLLTAINGHFKIPVAYFLTNGLTSEEQANVVNSVLRTLSERGIVVVALVFDGAATNISMINVLNRNGKTSSFFHHPLTKERIHIIWDACHMLKLIRNTLEDKKILHDAQGRPIEWRYIQMLFDLQDLNRIRLGNKLTKLHVQFHGKKMNVRLAAQTLSRSVADALDTLRETNTLFKDYGPTVEFIRIFDKLFDICNSKSKFGKYSKQPLNPETEKEYFNFFGTATKYIEGITLHKKKIISTQSYTGFLGFIQTMKSIRHIYDDNVRNGSMDYLLTYKLSQDHVELFFGCIRSRGGFNNNPNAIQLCSAYKQLMIHNEIKSPSQSNCISNDTTILTISSSRSKICHYADEDVDCGSPILSADYKGMVVSHGLNEIVSESVVYIAGFVEKSIRRSQSCLEALNDGKKATGTLLKKKDYGQFGGLCHPIMEVVVLCRIAEKNLQTVENEHRLNEARMYLRVVNKCLRDVPPKLLDNMDDHIKDCDPLENHRYFLIKAIIEEYLKVKLFYMGKLITSQLHKKFVRAKNTKLTLFEGQ